MRLSRAFFKFFQCILYYFFELPPILYTTFDSVSWNSSQPPPPTTPFRVHVVIIEFLLKPLSPR
jgi:hypothetical protein